VCNLLFEFCGATTNPPVLTALMDNNDERDKRSRSLHVSWDSTADCDVCGAKLPEMVSIAMEIRRAGGCLNPGKRREGNS